MPNRTMDIYEKRRAKLRLIRDTTFGGVAARLAEALELKAPAVSRWLSDTTTDGRNITEQSARSIERKLGLRPLELDHDVDQALVSELIDLVDHMSPTQREFAMKMLRAISNAEPDQPHLGSPNGAPLLPRQRLDS